MLRGFYTAAAGMLTQQRILNATANNVGNAKTPGYKEDHVITSTFEQELLTRQEGGKNTTIGKGSPVRVVQDVPSQMVQGPIEETGRDLDLAIEGEGYFSILSLDGETYHTRSGNFVLDEEGFLALDGKGRVQGLKGDIYIGTSEFTVTQQGLLLDKTGKVLDTLSINRPTDTTVLTKAPNGMFRMDTNPPLTPEQIQAQLAGTEVVQPAPEMVPAYDMKVSQGMLEGSNVDYNRSVSAMIEIQRNFQSCSKALQMIDAINQKTVNIAGV